MKNKGYWESWAKAAAVRAIKTVAESLLASITIGSAINEIRWGYITSVALVAGLASFLASVVGLPEVPDGKKDEDMG